MKIIFMGTSEFAVPSLLKLIESEHDVITVISQPDRPKGRGKKIFPTAVKNIALEYELPVYQPLKIKAAEAVAQIKNLEPDVIVVVSYGQIIPPAIIDYPRYGCINVHASLLPEFRGAAPIQRTLMEGRKITGVTTMYMDSGLDTGDIIMQQQVSVSEDIDHGQLATILAEKGAVLLVETLKSVEKGTAVHTSQKNEASTYAEMIIRRDELINWENTAESLHNRIRALCPRPGAYTTIDGMKLKIFKSRVVNTNGNGVIGQVTQLSKESFIVQTGKGLLEVLEIQKEGKKRMSAREFLRGYKLEPGNVLGN